MWEFAHILRGLVMRWTPPPGMRETERRMEALGRHLRELAADEQEFGEYLREFVLQHESEKIAFMEACVEEEEEAPAFWREDLDAYIEQTRLALMAPDFDIPFDMRKWQPAEARSLMCRMVAGYGRMLDAWPSAMRAARDLAQNS
jgi:hypothetical protein